MNILHSNTSEVIVRTQVARPARLTAMEYYLKTNNSPRTRFNLGAIFKMIKYASNKRYMMPGWKYCPRFTGAEKCTKE